MSRVVDAVLATAATSPTGMVTGEPVAPVRRSWHEIHQRARDMAAGLRAGGVGRGDAVAILAADPRSIAPTVQAVWLAGAAITMLHQPTPRSDLETWAEDTVRVLEMIGTHTVLLGAPFEPMAEVLHSHGIATRTLESLALESPALESPAEHPAEDFIPTPLAEDDTALLQLTSGSTAEPKAVRITHANLFANIHAIKAGAGLIPGRDTMVSWLPLFHDMGMVGFLIIPMLLGVELIKVTPTDFLSNQLLWAELITKYRCTVTSAPNFAYAVLARRLETCEAGRFDLSTLRLALNGAEPIDVGAVQRLCAAGARFGFDPGAVLCGYGMAESTLAISFAPLGQGMEIDQVDPDELELHQHAVPIGDSATARAFPLLGHPLPGMEVRVVDDAGRPLDDRQVGIFQIRGSGVTSGYLTTQGPRSALLDDGWLDTGDEGYLADGQTVVCGRRKDVIIVGGRNIYPTDVERAASAVPGVRAGNSAAVRLESTGRHEHFAVAVESREATDDTAAERIRSEVISLVTAAVGVRPFAVHVLPPGSLPKTPSGKLRRAALRTTLAAR